MCRCLTVAGSARRYWPKKNRQKIGNLGHAWTLNNYGQRATGNGGRKLYGRLDLANADASSREWESVADPEIRHSIQKPSGDANFDSTTLNNFGQWATGNG